MTFMILSVPILLNAHNATFIFVSALNTPILTFLAIRIYRLDSNSKVNQLFSLALIILVITFILFPLGGVLWYADILGVRAILVTTRLMQFSSFLSMVFLAWCARVLYLGENTWSHKENYLIVFLAAMVFIIAMLDPDSVYIISGPPDSQFIDTGEGVIYRGVYYLGTSVFIFSALGYFVRTYFEYRKDDPVLERQALLLVFGLLAALACFSVAFLSTLLVTYALTPIMLTSMTLGVILMSFSFSKEASLDRFKITSGLRRLKVLLKRGRTGIANAQIEFLKHIIDRHIHPAFYLHILILEAKIGMYHGILDSAQSSLEIALQFCEEQNHESFKCDLETEMNHLNVLKTAISLGRDFKSVEQTAFREPSLQDVVTYLDGVLHEHDSECVP